MRGFAEPCPDPQILQQAAAKLPWGHRDGIRYPTTSAAEIESRFRVLWTRSRMLETIALKQLPYVETYLRWEHDLARRIGLEIRNLFCDFLVILMGILCSGIQCDPTQADATLTSSSNTTLQMDYTA
jgi:hypothetical protein